MINGNEVVCRANVDRDAIAIFGIVQGVADEFVGRLQLGLQIAELFPRHLVGENLNLAWFQVS